MAGTEVTSPDRTSYCDAYFGMGQFTNHFYQGSPSLFSVQSTMAHSLPVDDEMIKITFGKSNDNRS